MTHARMKPKRGAKPDSEQRAYHGWLRSLGKCEACGATADLVLHHILPSTRRSHWLVTIICAPCHNGRTDSVHGLGSEEEFERRFGVNLVAAAIMRLAQWRVTK